MSGPSGCFVSQAGRRKTPFIPVLCPLDSVISGGVDRRETQRLRKRNQQLEEENNLLRLKVDILLDMLSETTAESHLKDKELDELKVTNRRRK